MNLPDVSADFEWCNANGELGHGTFGVVRLVKLRATGELMAAKCFNKFVPHTEVLKEAAILQSLTHPNVVHHHSLAGSGKRMYLVMEYCVLGSLQSHNAACGYAIPLEIAGNLQLARQTNIM